MDENFHVIYTNEKVTREGWRTFKVGQTRFNDDAVRRAGESPPPAQIEGMPPPPQRTDTVSLAQQVMNDNTNQLDTKQEMDRLDMQRDGTQSPDFVNDSASGSREILDDADPKKKKKKTNSFLSRFMPGKSSD
ncbi:hypothetical protein HYQ46_001420 [Verticillium longisporum]|nr:hypothetical protein HYQ46_001420 [Verticillium longisporum]